MGIWTISFTAPTKENILLMFKEDIINLRRNMRNQPYPGEDSYTKYARARSAMFPLSNAKPLLPGFGSVINDVTSFQYPISISPCGATSRHFRFIFIAVFSTPENFVKRNIIRQTWAKDLQNMWAKYYTHFEGFAFILGRAETSMIQKRVANESKQYRDIIQIDMPNFYENQHMKDAGFLYWLSKNCFLNCTGDIFKDCFRNSYILKVHDDVYVNIRNLQYFLHNSADTQLSDNPSIYGMIHRSHELGYFQRGILGTKLFEHGVHLGHAHRVIFFFFVWAEELS